MDAQPGLFDGHAPRQRKRVNVPSTSVAAYLERPRDGRVAAVVRALESWPGRTSMELAEQFYGDPHAKIDTERVWYIRRGLSDALAQGLVEHAGKRACRCIGRVSLTWKVTSR